MAQSLLAKKLSKVKHMNKIKEQLEDWKNKVLVAYEQTERLAQDIEELDDRLEAMGWILWKRKTMQTES
eukprot:6049728-Heterocapsa_arctica.AAC.1